MFKNRLKWRLVLVVLFSILHFASFGQVVDKPYAHKLRNVEENLQKGNLPLALQEIEDILKSYPDAAEVYYAKALLYGQLQNSEIAIENARKAYEIERKIIYAHYLLDLYKADEEYQNALALIDSLILDHPSSSELFREKVMLLHRDKRSSEALSVIKETEDLFGYTDTLAVIHSEILIDLDRRKEAKEILENWVRRKSDLKQIYSALAFIMNSEKESKGAVEVLNKGIANTGDDYLYLDLADVYNTLNKTKNSFESLKTAFESESIEYFEKHRVMLSLLADKNSFSLDQLYVLSNQLVRQYPRIADSHLFKGDVLWRKGETQEAKTLFLTAVGINNKHVDAWRMLINVDLSLNDANSAILHGLESLKFNAGHPLLLYFTGLAYLVNEDSANARKFLEEGLNNSEESNLFLKSSIYTALGDVYHKLEMHAVSDVAYEEAIKLDSTNVSALNNYAYYLSLRGKELEKAAQLSMLSNELSPNNGTFQDTYAWILYKQENYKEALVWIERALKNTVAPSFTLFDHYGDILFELGKNKEAAKQWQKALKLGKDTGEDIEALSNKLINK